MAHCLTRCPIRCLSCPSLDDIIGRFTRLDDREPEIDVAVRSEYVSQRWAAALLFFAGVSAGLAFVLPLVAMVAERYNGQPKLECFDKQPCPSGKLYMADTVSEMVSITTSPSGKLFRCFAVIASIMLLMSRYPFHLSNVSTPQQGTCSLVSLRSICVPIGMLMVAWITIMPVAERSSIDGFVCDLHTLGARLFMLGYSVVESLTLRRIFQDLQPLERKLRVGAVISTLCFIVSYILMGSLDSKKSLCCADQWEETESAFVRVYGNVSSLSDQLELNLVKWRFGHKVLTDTASGTVRALKFLCFGSEVGAGLSIIFSHMVIWYFSQERIRLVPSVRAVRLPEV